MTDTTHFLSTDHISGQRTGAPHIAGTALAFTPHRYNQDEVASVLTKVGGPEFMRFAHSSGHPNYTAVVMEVAASPLVHSAWLTAIIFSIANALVFNVRIRAENAALGYA